MFGVDYEFHILICKLYKIGVCLSEVATQLKGIYHRWSPSIAIFTQSTVEQWEDIHDPPDIAYWPTQIDQLVPEIAKNDDGLLCL